MLKQISVFLVALTATLGITGTTLAGDQAAKPAKIVVYRADEASKTRKVKFQVRLDQSQVGKLKYGNAIILSVAPGNYSMDTTLAGTQPLELDLQPGQTYFVYTRVDKLGHKVTPVLELVEARVAMAQQPAISNAI